MLRLLLVIDDYNEMVYLQTLLKKLGFDVEGIQNQRKFEESLLSVNPQVVVATARGKRVDGLAIANEMAKKAVRPKIILLRTSQQGISEKEFELPQIDVVLDSPVNIKLLLGALAQVGGIDDQVLLDKYSKLKTKAEEPVEEDVLKTFKESVFGAETSEELRPEKVDTTLSPPVEMRDEEGQSASTGKAQSGATEAAVQLKPTNMTEAQRKERFENVLKDLELPKNNGFDPSQVKTHNRQLRQAENIDELHDLEEERKSFVKALFNRRKNH